MTDADWDDNDDAPLWFSPFAWPRWARIAFAVTLPISGPLWCVAFIAGGCLAGAIICAGFCIVGPVCLAVSLFKK